MLVIRNGTPLLHQAGFLIWEKGALCVHKQFFSETFCHTLQRQSSQQALLAVSFQLPTSFLNYASRVQYPVVSPRLSPERGFNLSITIALSTRMICTWYPLTKHAFDK